MKIASEQINHLSPRRESELLVDVRRRFRLDEDMEDIYERIATDDFMRRAVEAYQGMRLTINDPWETTMCFIISQLNNVKRIRLITKRIMARFGSDIDGAGIKTFPASDVLAKASVKDFFECGSGFRAKYLRSAADYCTNNLDLYKLQGKDYQKIKEELMEIDGVGDKVADCIALMGYGKIEAFPIDVWIKRMLEKIYFKGRKKKLSSLHDFVDVKKRDEDVRGYVQQYIYWFGRQIDKG